MELLFPAAAVAFVAVPLIAALYFLKARGPEVPVSSLQLWPKHLADRQANAPWKRLRLGWLLLVQLLLATVLAVCLMRPGLVGATGVGRTTVVLLDASPSMRATDVAPSRFQAAVGRAKAMAGELGSDGQMGVVLLGGHAQLLLAPTNDGRALRAALDGASPSGGAANLEEGISVANAVLAGRPDGSVVLLSDGHAARPASPLRLAAPLTYEPIGSTAENVALESIGRMSRGDVFLHIANLGTMPRDLTVELRADGRLVDVLPVHVEPGSSAETTWSRLPAGTSVLEARLNPGDDFSLDDAAWLVTAAPTRRRVLLVTRGNGFLTHALGLREDLDVTVVSPTDYKPAPYDLSIFDGFVPPGPLPEPALVIAPPEGTGPVPAGPPADPGPLVPANPREPLLADVSLRDVHVQVASTAKAPEGWRMVIAATNGPLLLVRQGKARVAQLTFDLHRSDLPIRAAFPILVDNLVSYLMPGGFEDKVLPLGEPVQLVGRPGATSVEVTAPGGRTRTLALPTTLEGTSEPGVYTLRETAPGGVTTSRLVVELQDPSQSQIGPGQRPDVQALARPLGDAPKGTLELWPWLAGLALAVVLFETFLYLRA
ncbi:MAG: VWA domain-containing protein [Acidimicrobiales bacterium]